jgi:DNA-binding NarL/FixJ family response regulator
MTRIRVLVVEEHDKVRRKVAARLGSEACLELVGAVAPGKADVAMVQRGQPQVIPMGLGMKSERWPATEWGADYTLVIYTGVSAGASQKGLTSRGACESFKGL